MESIFKSRILAALVDTERLLTRLVEQVDTPTSDEINSVLLDVRESVDYIRIRSMADLPDVFDEGDKADPKP